MVTKGSDKKTFSSLIGAWNYRPYKAQIFLFQKILIAIMPIYLVLVWKNANISSACPFILTFG